MKKFLVKKFALLLSVLFITFTFLTSNFYSNQKVFASQSDLLVHFYKPSDWNNPNIYYYGDTLSGPTWPGTTMSVESDGWYNYTIKNASTSRVIFNDGSVKQIPSAGQAGFSVSSEVWYKDGQITTHKPNSTKNEVNIYVEKPDNWNDIWIWYDSDLSTTAWDTTSLKSYPGDMINYRSSWYKKTIQANGKIQFLFNDGTWSKKLQNNGVDFTTDKDIWISKSGAISYEDPLKESTITPTAIKLIASDSINVGESISVNSYITYSDGSEKQEIVNWSISDTSLASLSTSTGISTNITGIKAGKVIITANINNLSLTKEITINDLSSNFIKVFFKSNWSSNKIYYWATVPTITTKSWPGVDMISEGDGWYSYTFNGTTSTNLIFNNGAGSQTGDLTRTSGTWYYYNNSWTDKDPRIDLIAPTITASPQAGKYESSSLNISLSAKDNSDSSPKIYYTTDLTEPTNNSILYTSEIIINKDTTIKAIAIDKSGNVSSVYTLGYSLNNDITAPIVIASPSSGRYLTSQKVKFTITDNKDSNPLLYFTTDGSKPELTEKYLYKGQEIYISEDTKIYTIAIDSSGNKIENYFIYNIGEVKENDFREETIYFVMTTRFYDGDPSNNVHCWDDTTAKNPDSDPAWRGDFKGLTDKLDYIKALGFSAIWVTPPVKNASGYDYHGYHAINHSEIDPRYKTKYDTSAEESYQKFINAAHAKGMKVIQDIVLNHTSNFGEENLFPMFRRLNPTGLNETISTGLSKIENSKLPSNYDTLTPALQYSSRINAMKENSSDTDNIYHHEKSLEWEGYTVQTGQIAGDCVDLNTENPTVSDYLIDSYSKYINMGVDSFRIDTVKHISRLTFNNEFIPKLKAEGGDDFYMFGEVCTRVRDVWNRGIPALSAPFYTWKENKNYAWGDRVTNESSTLKAYNDNLSVSNQPTSINAFLNGNTYKTPDYSMKSGLDVIDFPMHWNFANARDAFRVAVEGDAYYNDATWNVTYVDSHDYAPDTAPENQRFALGQDVWAENLSLMFTFRGIPTLYYGSEIEFQKGKSIDVGPNAPLSQTGRAYFGDYIEGTVETTDFGLYSNASGTMAETLANPLAKHITRLNRIRRAIPALQKGEYSVKDITGDGMAYKRRFTDTESGVDSFVLVTVSGSATFNNIPNGKYVDAVTGEVINVTNGILLANCSGKGNLRVFVLDLPGNPAPGKIGEDTKYMY